MNLDDIRTILTDYIIENFNVSQDDDEFTPDVNLFDYGYLDSLGASAMISFIENKFGFKVTRKDLMLYSLNTINEISEYVEKKVENKI